MPDLSAALKTGMEYLPHTLTMMPMTSLKHGRGTRQGVTKAGQLGRGIFGNETTAETVQSCLELLQGALSARNIVGVVVAANDQYVVCRVVHLFIEVQEGLAPFLGLAVEYQASAIAPIVAVGHVVFLGHEIVPCLRKGTFVVFHIAVANDVDGLTIQRCAFDDGFRIG